MDLNSIGLGPLEEEEGTRGTLITEERPHEDTRSRRPPASQGERPRENPSLPIP